MEKRILTEEQKKLLTGYLPFNCKNTIEFVPSLFENFDVEIRPSFKVRSLTNLEQNQLKINSAKYWEEIEGKSQEQIVLITSKLGTESEDIIYKCILGFSNFFDAGSGEEIIFERTSNENYISIEQYRIIPEWIKTEIIMFIRKISCLSAPEKLSLK